MVELVINGYFRPYLIEKEGVSDDGVEDILVGVYQPITVARQCVNLRRFEISQVNRRPHLVHNLL